MKTKHLFLSLLFSIQYIFCFAQWNYIGLAHAGNTTNLTITNDTIYASTHDGIYKKDIYSNDTNWIACGMQGNHVVQTLVPNNQTFISVVEIAAYTTQIYKSNNGGATFNLMNPDTSNFVTYPFLNQIAHPEGNYDTLYFLHHQIKTYNGGLTWDTIPNNVLNDRFIAVNRADHDNVIIGGETWALSAYLQTSPDNGFTWNYPTMTNYFGGDNCVHDMVMDNTGTWTAAGEGVICRTSDGGNNWTQLLNVWGWPLEWQLYMWDIEESPGDNNRMYVTGDNTLVTQVPLYYSLDGGANWDTISTSAVVSPPAMKCIAIHSIIVGDKVFLGGNGVYTFDILLEGINEDEKETFMLSPNPATTAFTISDLRSTISKIEIYNVLGEKVFSENQESRIRSQVVVDVSDFNPGVYFVKLISEKGSATQKVVIQR